MAEYRRTLVLSTVEKQIEDGDLLAFRGRTWFSALIRWKTKARVTHVGLACRVHGRLSVLEALEGRGVRVWPMDKYLSKNADVDWYSLRAIEHDMSREKCMRYALSKWGSAYAAKSQFLRSWGVVTKWVCDKLRVPKTVDLERFFCSQFVLATYRQGGYKGNGMVNPSSAAPGDVVQLGCLEYQGRLVSDWAAV